VEDVEETVTKSISDLGKSMSHVGPNLTRGLLTLSFYDKRETKGFFGILNSEEKVYFERWRIPILVNDNQFPRDNDPASEMNRLRLIETAREQIKMLMLTIFEVHALPLPPPSPLVSDAD
jgi:hypothetical protein